MVKYHIYIVTIQVRLLGHKQFEINGVLYPHPKWQGTINILPQRECAPIFALVPHPNTINGMVSTVGKIARKPKEFNMGCHGASFKPQVPL